MGLDRSEVGITSINKTVSLLLALRGNGIHDTALLRAFELVNRSSFVDQRYHDLVAADVSIPIECGQIQSAPSLLAKMLNLLDIRSSSRVLEIGTGSGYGTALIAMVAREVVSIERFHALVRMARSRMVNLPKDVVSVRLDDGLRGNPSLGLFDRIVLNGSVTHVPSVLFRQLAPEGILVCVVSGPGEGLLCKFKVTANKEITQDKVGPIDLSPLIPGVAEFL